MSLLATVGTVVSLVDKALGLMPTYDQRKKAEWLDLKKEYLKQVNLEMTERDADLILNLRDAVLLFADNFAKS